MSCEFDAFTFLVVFATFTVGIVGYRAYVAFMGEMKKTRKAHEINCGANIEGLDQKERHLAGLILI